MADYEILELLVKQKDECDNNISIKRGILLHMVGLTNLYSIRLTYHGQKSLSRESYDAIKRLAAIKTEALFSHRGHIREISQL